MKFQCGECQKNYSINNIHTTGKDIEFQCDGCKNIFTINRNQVFSSSSKNSKVICENCGKLIPENCARCDSCNLILNKIHEELRIDNKAYETLQINENGDITSTLHAKKPGEKTRVIVSTITVLLVITISLFFLTKFDVASTLPLKQSAKSKQTETQIVILNSGQTYYADEVNSKGGYIEIKGKDGVVTKVLEKDVHQISKAIIDH